MKLSIWAQAMKDMRESRDWSQRFAARMLKVDASCICHIEAGRRQPSVGLLESMAAATGRVLALHVKGAP